MIFDWQRECGSYELDEVPSDIRVSTQAFHTVFEPYENSWGTMVTLRTRRNSAARETSLLTSTRFL